MKEIEAARAGIRCSDVRSVLSQPPLYR